MRTAVLHKFRANVDIRTVLLATGDVLLVENSPTDYYWGSGADGTGLNRLGQILIQVRSQLRTELQPEQNDW